MTKILIVDDEECIVELLKFNLEKEGYNVIALYEGNSVLSTAIFEQPEVILLDLMMPGIDGLQVCRLIRFNEKTSHIPIIIITAKADEIDKILGLELGADDYVTKPFSPREVIARIKAQLRRRHLELSRHTQLDKQLEIGEIILKPERYEVTISGKKLILSLKEFELLKLFISNPGRVLTREVILENIWGHDYISDSRTVDVHISYLRQKIEKDPQKPHYIETLRGVGYRFKG